MFRLKDFPDLTASETGLIKHLREGKPGFFKASDALPPPDAPPGLHIRASLIRALILRQVTDVPLPERGLRIWGAVIRGDGPPEAETPGLDLEGATLQGDLALMACHISDGILLRGARIKSLFLDGSRLFSCLDADRLYAEGGVFLRRVAIRGHVSLLGAQLVGSLDCNDANLTFTGRALNADRLSANGGVLLRRVTCSGEIHILGAQLGGNLDCEDARLTSTGDAINADNMSTNGSVFLRRVTSSGRIRLIGARLGGNLSCVGARLTAADCALSADSLSAEGGVFLNCMVAAGEVRLLGAQLGRDLSCNGAILTSTDRALSADGMSTKGSVFLRGVTCGGEIRLLGAQLGGNLECDGAKLEGAGCSLICDGAKIAGAWFWRGGAYSQGMIDMTDAEIGSICDDPGCWPPEILLNRCRYGAFTGKGVDGAQRIGWLSRQKQLQTDKEFLPQPYEECARALREAGHVADARMVLIEKERLQRRARHLRLGRELAQAEGGYRKLGLWLQRWLSRGGDALVGGLVAYGRRPLQAAVPLVVILLLGAMIFAVAAGRGQIKPNLPQIQRAPEWVSCGQTEGTAITGLSEDAATVTATGRARGGETQLACFLRQPEARSYPRFNPLVYSADTLLPIVSLEMQSYWIPDDSKPVGAFARVWLWLHIFAGWGLTLLAVAGFSGLIKTDSAR